MSYSSPLAIGTRLEPLFDARLIGELRGAASRRLHAPEAREIALVHDRPWEGNTSLYHTVVPDGGRYRMYYRGSHYDTRRRAHAHPEVVCYAESEDGIAWRRPALNLVPFQGSTRNNVLLTGPGSHNFAPFRDENPAADPACRYKALATVLARDRSDASGDHVGPALCAWASPDGLQWHRLSEEPVITEGKFDSHNLAFWDGQARLYRAYYRDFFQHADTRVRGIRTARSADFLHWEGGEWLDYGDAAATQLYTNQVQPYPRAPHVLVGFPTRFLAERDSLTEGLFMTSRDGIRFERWEEALIRPGLNREHWGNRSNYIMNGLWETPSGLPGAPPELSLFASEGYYEGGADAVRRYAIRPDGFVSVHAPRRGGELVTPPIRLEGDRLLLNLSTSAAGACRVEVQDAEGEPLAGLSLEDATPIYGDGLELEPAWAEADLSRHKGEAVRFRFALEDADLFALRIA